MFLNVMPSHNYFCCKSFITFLAFSGTSTPTGKFFASIVILSSHEDAPAWASIYKFVRDLGIEPKYLMGDGAKAITKAGFDIFSKDAVKRLMCWSHTHRNILPQLNK